MYSDIHLGVDKFAARYFNNELKRIARIKANEQIFVKYLILNGDTWDRLVRMDKFFDRQSTKEILREIASQGTKIIPILGNHEISVSGDYDGQFTKRKKDFFKGYDWNFIDNSLITQFVILTKLKDEMRLHAYDSIDEINSSIFKNSNPNNNYLICHGFQFQNKLELMAKFWNFCLRGNEHRRDFCKRIWYRLVGGRWIRRQAEDLDDRWVDRFEEIDINFVEIQEVFNEQTRNEPYYQRIVKFFQNNNLFDFIGNVVFGHTHAPVNGERIGSNEQLVVYNTGSWIEYDKYFHLLEIDMASGKSNLLRSDKVYLKKKKS